MDVSGFREGSDQKLLKVRLPIQALSKGLKFGILGVYSGSNIFLSVRPFTDPNKMASQRLSTTMFFFINCTAIVYI